MVDLSIWLPTFNWRIKELVRFGEYEVVDNVAPWMLYDQHGASGENAKLLMFCRSTASASSWFSRGGLRVVACDVTEDAKRLMGPRCRCQSLACNFLFSRP